MKFLKQREEILNGNMYKVIIMLAFPLMLNNLIQTVYNLTDTYFVSKIGGTQVAAITFVWPVIFLIMAFAMGIGIAGTAMISQFIGAHNLSDAEETAGQVFSFSFFISLLLGLIGYISSPIILQLMGGEGMLLSEGTNYLQIIFLSSPLMAMSFSYSSIKHAEGDTITPMVISLISVAINIALDPLFIFGFKMGIKGAGYATFLARFIAALMIIYKLLRKNKGVKIKVKNFLPKWELIVKLLKIGLPSSLGHSMTAFGFVMLNLIVVKFGDETLAALGIGNRINSLLFMPAMGIGSAITSIAGQNIGANQFDRVKEAVIKSCIISLAYSILGTALLIMIRTPVARAFTDNPVILEKCTHYLVFVALSVPPMGLFTIFLGLFQGAGHTVLTMMLSLSRLWVVRLPGILLLQMLFSLNEDSVWYSVFFSNIIMSLISLLIYMSGMWKKKVIKGKAELANNKVNN